MRCKESHLFFKVQKMSWKPYEAQEQDPRSQEIVFIWLINVNANKDINRIWIVGLTELEAH
jgi:hypothetical protein